MGGLCRGSMLSRSLEARASVADMECSGAYGQVKLPEIRHQPKCALSARLRNALVLLRHKRLRLERALVKPVQHGHRGRRLAIATINRRRMVAIELGMWRSGRNGGSSGSVTVGYGRLREQPGSTR